MMAPPPKTREQPPGDPIARIGHEPRYASQQHPTPSVHLASGRWLTRVRKSESLGLIRERRQKLVEPLVFEPIQAPADQRRGVIHIVAGFPQQFGIRRLIELGVHR